MDYVDALEVIIIIREALRCKKIVQIRSDRGLNPPSILLLLIIIIIIIICARKIKQKAKHHAQDQLKQK